MPAGVFPLEGKIQSFFTFRLVSKFYQCKCHYVVSQVLKNKTAGEKQVVWWRTEDFECRNKIILYNMRDRQSCQYTLSLVSHVTPVTFEHSLFICVTVCQDVDWRYIYSTGPFQVNGTSLKIIKYIGGIYRTFSVCSESGFRMILLECDNSMMCIVIRWLIQQTSPHHHV